MAPPPELQSEASVVAYVLHNIGAIGYVSAGSKTGVEDPRRAQR